MILGSTDCIGVWIFLLWSLIRPLGFLSGYLLDCQIPGGLLGSILGLLRHLTHSLLGCLRHLRQAGAQSLGFVALHHYCACCPLCPHGQILMFPSRHPSFHTFLLLSPLVPFSPSHLVGLCPCCWRCVLWWSAYKERSHLVVLVFPRWLRLSRALIAHARVVPGAFRVGFSLGFLVHSVRGSLVVILSRGHCWVSGSVFSIVFFQLFPARALGCVRPLSLSLIITVTATIE